MLLNCARCTHKDDRGEWEDVVQKRGRECFKEEEILREKVV